jgi:putative methionine-R-sulfoxide reductase with GAF domain
VNEPIPLLPSSLLPLVDPDAAVGLARRLGLESPGPSERGALASRLESWLDRSIELPSEMSGLLDLHRYPVPKLGEGGSCSLAHELEPEPFDLRDEATRRLDAAALARHPETIRLARLGELVRFLHEESRSDWSGIYRRIPTAEGYDALRKEACLGRPSRALFPLTAEFAATSNNSTAARSGRAILVDDVDAHLAAGRPYYECDADVRSELCVPILDGDRTIGLVDLEAFVPRRYGPRESFAVALVGIVLARGGLLPGERS